MTRIWYSVHGEGKGHAIRSYSIISKLNKKHELVITASGNAYSYLKKKFPSKVYRIRGFRLVYVNNSVDMWETLKLFFSKRIKKTKISISLIKKIIKKFKPQIILSDFETHSFYAKRFTKLPLISIDNGCVLTECKINLPKQKKFELFLVRILLKILYPKIDYYFISTFAKIKPQNNQVTIIPPIIRNELLNAKTNDKGFVLVYQTSPTNTSMLDILSMSKRKYKIYGMHSNKNFKNITFHRFNDQTFLENMKNCSYLIINGGYTTISEALYLKKPILCIPIKNQIEQYYNGYSIKNLQYGSFTEELTITDLNNFEKQLDKYKKKLSKVKWNDNYINKIEEKISLFSRRD